MKNKDGIFSNKKIILPFIIVVALLCAVIVSVVKNRHNEEYQGYYVFGIDAKETKVMYEKYTPKKRDGEDLVKEFLHRMQQEPNDVSMKKAIPDNVSVDEYVLDENGDLTLYMDAAYGNYSGVNEILRRAAIVKTLCQIPEVEAVQFYVAGQPLTDSNLETIGFMTADTFIDNTGGESVYQQKATVNMYFASEKGDTLVEVPVEITYDATIPLEQLVIEQLMKGPNTIDGASDQHLQATIPKNVTLNKVSIKDHTCYVDFSEEFLNKREGITAQVAVYSVVDTLIELPEVNKVQFSIDGEQVLLYNDTLRFGEVFSRNLDIVE